MNGTCNVKLFLAPPPGEGSKGQISFGPQREKTCLRGFANNTGADQPAHPRSLFRAV